MKTTNYWKFTVIFWITAGLLLFFNSQRIPHWHQVQVRFVYFSILGLVITCAFTLIFQSPPVRKLKHAWLPVIGLAAVAAVFVAAVLNPLTYLLLGVSMPDKSIDLLTAGTLYNVLFFLLWSIIYFQLDGRPLFGTAVAKNPGNFINKIGVDDNGQVRVLPVSDIECVTASGDYVEIHIADSSFLKKETIAALENLLDPHIFCRVHRSSIVNANKITGITSRGSGTYTLSTASGRVVTSSRSYRNAVKDLRKSG